MENREYIKTGSQVYWRTLFIIFLGSMAAFGAEYCVQPIIPVIASSFGLNAVQGSLAVSLGLVGMSAAMLLIAGLAPRFDRNWQLLSVDRSCNTDYYDRLQRQF